MNATQSNLLGIVLGSSVAALLFAVWLARWVLARSRGTAEMQTISDAIQQGCSGMARSEPVPRTMVDSTVASDIVMITPFPWFCSTIELRSVAFDRASVSGLD